MNSFRRPKSYWTRRSEDVKLAVFLPGKASRALEPIDRQELLWRSLRTHFDREDQLLISSLITLTPAEYAGYREPQMA